MGQASFAGLRDDLVKCVRFDIQQHIGDLHRGSSLYEPINVYKPLAPDIGVVEGPFEYLTVGGADCRFRSQLE